MEIGAHTMTHPILRPFGRRCARRDRGQSARPRTHPGASVRAFAYPNGRPGDDYTERDRNLVESLGFDYAPSTRWGAGTSNATVYQLPRFTPWDRTRVRWLVRLLLAFRDAA